jgi:hypothetical protein
MRVPVRPLRPDFCGQSSCNYCYHNVADNETETAIDAAMNEQAADQRRAKELINEYGISCDFDHEEQDYFEEYDAYDDESFFDVEYDEPEPLAVEVTFDDLLSRDVTPNEIPTVSKTDGEDICNRILQVENLTAIYRERGEA